MNEMHAQVIQEDANSAWAGEALGNRDIDDAAVKALVKAQIGDSCHANLVSIIMKEPIETGRGPVVTVVSPKHHSASCAGTSPVGMAHRFASSTATSAHTAPARASDTRTRCR